MKKLFKNKLFIGFLVVVVLFVGYLIYKLLAGKGTTVSYITVPAKNGELVVNVSGSGQVSAEKQVNINPQTSGNLIYALSNSNGLSVAAGTVLAKIDPTDAENSLQNAELSLQNAELSLQKTTGGSTSTTDFLLKSEAESNLQSAYDSGYSQITSSFSDMSDIMQGLKNIIYANDFSKTQSDLNYYVTQISQYDNNAAQAALSDVYSTYQTAVSSYNQNLADYQNYDTSSTPEEVNSLLSETYTSTKVISDAVKSEIDLLQLYKNDTSKYSLYYSPTADSQLTTLNGLMTKISSDISGLLTEINSIQSSEDAVNNALLTLQSDQIAVNQAETAVQNAQTALADDTITAPFNGIIGNMSVSIGDYVTPSTNIATIFTSDKYVAISLNEVDVAKVKVGQDATVTFDALPGVTLDGKVSQINPVGSVSQGVVTYEVDISLNSGTGFSQIKPGMSANVNITIEDKKNVLLVPSGAVNTARNQSFVRVLENGAPVTKDVTVGSTNDTMTEITSGLSEGDEVIVGTRNVTASSATTASGATAAGGAQGSAARNLGGFYRAVGGGH